MKARIRDGLNFLGRMNGKRISNIASVLGSYYAARFTRKPYHAGFPISVSIEPTTSCNLRCPECPSGLREFSRPTGMLQTSLFNKVIDEVSPYTPYLILYFQGEPYLNKNFFDFVNYASSKNMYVATSTNAHYLNDTNARKTVESGLSRLIISIDGTTQDTYEQYRIGGRIDKVFEGAKNIVAWKRKLKSNLPHVIFQYLVVKPNEHQVDDIKRIAKEIGVDEVKFKTAQVYDYENGNELIPENEKYSRYKKNASGKYEIKNALLNHCWKLWHSCVFTWDGKVVPCCFDKDATHVLGDVEQESFASLWHGKAYQNFRGAVLRSRKEIDICQNCTEGTTVWV